MKRDGGSRVNYREWVFHASWIWFSVTERFYIWFQKAAWKAVQIQNRVFFRERQRKIGDVRVWQSVAWGAQKFGECKMFDFRRVTLFCFEKRLSEQKMTIYFLKIWGHGPLATPMATMPFHKNDFLLFLVWVKLFESEWYFSTQKRIVWKTNSSSSSLGCREKAICKTL